MELIVTIGVTALVSIVGIALGYLVWLKTRPKKKAYNARIYTLTEGRSLKKLKNGGKIRLNELIPYGHDTIEVLNQKGISITRLKGLKKVINSVPPGSVEKWGKDERIVNLVYHLGEVYIMKKRFDLDNNLMIFDPLPQSRVNMIKTEITLRQNRLKDEKDLLAAVTPWIVAGIIMVGLVACAWIMTEGYLKISESNANAAAENRKTIEVAAGITQEIYSNIAAMSGIPRATIPEPHDLGAQDDGS